MTKPVTRETRAIRTNLRLEDVSGLSDLTADGSGNLWTVAERQKMLLGINGGQGGTRLPIALNETVDLESLAWLTGDEFAFGTESDEVPRNGDVILFGKKTATGVTITGRLPVATSLWGISASKNHGFEGLCAADGVLIAALEEAKQEGAKRLSPLARIDLKTRTVTPFWLKLTSDKGKVSALSCRTSAGGNEIEITAIERNFGVARIISSRMLRYGDSKTLHATSILDLLQYINTKEKVNFEGIVVTSPSQMILINDNDYGGITGPTFLLQLTSNQ